MFYYLPIILTIVSNLLYHIFQKTISSTVNPVLSLIITYLTAAVACVLIFPFFPLKNGILASLREMNWATLLLGIAIIGLELGFLLAYRAGWDISLAAVISNSAVSILLIPIGVLIFKESVSLTNMAGIVFSIIGIILMNYK